MIMHFMGAVHLITEIAPKSVGMGGSMNDRRKTAWVITREGVCHQTEVVGVLSAKLGSQKIKERVEWLYALFHSGIEMHLEAAKYQKPDTPCEAKYMTNNSGVPVDSVVRCGGGGRQYIVARRAKDVRIINPDAKTLVLEWTEPDRPILDKATLSIVKEIQGSARQAPVHLPLRITSNELNHITGLPVHEG